MYKKFSGTFLLKKIKKLKFWVQKTSRNSSENFCEKVKITTCSEEFHVKKIFFRKLNISFLQKHEFCFHRCQNLFLSFGASVLSCSLLNESTACSSGRGLVDLLLSNVLPVCKVSVVSLLPVSQNRARWTSAQRLLLQTVYFCWSFVPVWWHVCWLQVRQTNRRHVPLVYCPDPITQRPVRPTGSVRQSKERSEHVQSHRLLWKHPDSTHVCPVSAEKCGKLNARPQLCLRWTDVTLTDTCQPIREQVLSVWAAQEHHVQTSCHTVCSRPTAGTTLAAPGEW